MKRIILVLALISISLGYSQVKIKGVVTYYFNQYQGNKPDIGATVVIVDTSKVKNFNYELWNNFKYAKAYRNMYSNYKKVYEKYEYMYNETLNKKKRTEENERYKAGMDDAQKYMSEYLNTLEKYNSETDEKFKTIDKSLFPTFFQFLSGKEPFIETTVDGNGTYSINVNPGVYYVYIKSKNRTGLTITDASGITYLDKVTVKDNDKDVSTNFEIQ